MSKQKKMFCYLPTTAISESCLWCHLGCSRTRFWWWCCHWLRGIRYWSADWSKMWLLLLFQGAYKKENTHVTHAHVRGKSSMLWKQIRGEAITATIWFDNSWITQDYYVIKLQTPAVIIQMNQLFSLHSAQGCILSCSISTYVPWCFTHHTWLQNMNVQNYRNKINVITAINID